LSSAPRPRCDISPPGGRAPRSGHDVRARLAPLRLTVLPLAPARAPQPRACAGIGWADQPGARLRALPGPCRPRGAGREPCALAVGRLVAPLPRPVPVG